MSIVEHPTAGGLITVAGVELGTEGGDPGSRARAGPAGCQVPRGISERSCLGGPLVRHGFEREGPQNVGAEVPVLRVVRSSKGEVVVRSGGVEVAMAHELQEPDEHGGLTDH
jgi:hypothetical protein